MKNKIEEARKRYLPKKITCMLIAEAPPNAPGRFFYYELVDSKDFLFLGVMGALYPYEKSEYINWNRQPQRKEKLLRRFQADGYYLMDIFNIPIEEYYEKHLDNIDDTVNELIENLNSLIDADTPIILIKKFTYDMLDIRLRREGFNVINKGVIPFPSSGQQTNFKKGFKQALEMAGFM